GKTVHAQVMDSCPACGIGDLDMSPAVFQKHSPLDDGVIPGISWYFMYQRWHP
ncbi:hypothetical protein BDQ17DRAFT_1250921, partial [Cyathus striatus]